MEREAGEGEKGGGKKKEKQSQALSWHKETESNPTLPLLFAPHLHTLLYTIIYVYMSFLY